MIISRTPLRISLGGGGTDVPSFYRNHGHGFLIAAAITKYIYVAVNRNFDEDILLKYSEVERAKSVNDIRHPLLRECLKHQGVRGGVEISSMADIPTGTGLGSSGSFTVGVLKALNLYNHGSLSNDQIAQVACQIEIDRLAEPVGKQDQYIAAIGGITAFTFSNDESVSIEQIRLNTNTRQRLEENLLLFFTGFRRSASEVLAEERSTSSGSASRLDESLLQTRDIGYATREALLNDNLDSFGRILSDQWKLKLLRQSNDTNLQIDEWITAGVSSGALGGKLVGAGGGGFLMFYAEDKFALRKKMSELGLPEVTFGFDYEGSSLIVAR